MIPYGRQSIDESDIAAVTSVLRSEFLTQGPMVPRFEGAIARRSGSAHAVAFNSATSALHAACLALGVGPGDTVWTSPISFVASANCARYCGAAVDFVDIDPSTFTMDPGRLERKLATTPPRRLPKVIIPVHMCGQPCAMAAIRRLADAFGARVVEDASHALGASCEDIPVGACRHSDITVFSFHPVKIVTSGEGGVATTNDPELAQRMRLAGNHGTTRDPARMTGVPDGPWSYEQVALGYNYRLTDVAAALGLSQLDRLDGFLARRRTVAAAYTAAFTDLETVALPREMPGRRSSWHLYVIRLTGDPTHRRAVFEDLRAAGIGVQVHYIPIHTQPYYAALGFKTGDFPDAEDYYRRAISLPLHPNLSDEQIDQIVQAVRDTAGALP